MWETLLKNNLIAPSSKTSGKWNLNSKPIPQREEVKPEPEPKTTCVEEFNKIVDWVLGEINRTEGRSAPLWNTQTDKGPNELTPFDIGQGHKNHFMTWTYYFRNADEYNKENYYDHALISSEHVCWHADNEEAACKNLIGLSKASVSVDRELRETVQDDFIQLEYGMRLNSYDFSGSGMFGEDEGSGAIQMQTDVIDVKANPYILNWSDEDKAKYIPAINKVLKEHDNIYRQIIQRAKNAVRKLEL